MLTGEKREIRARMRRQRRSLSVEYRESAANSLIESIFELRGIGSANRIGAYFSNDGEIDPALAMLEFNRRGQQCFVPVLLRGQAPRLRFGKVSSQSRLCQNQFGIREPCISQKACLNPSQLDWIFVPLIAFNSLCNRVGMGGGYYDASLALLKSRDNWQKPRLIGLAYEFQRVDHIVTDRWDIPMHGILTDEGFYPAIDRPI